MSNWVGYAISVNCGEPLGCYQGTILEADGSTITLTKAFRNGFPYPKSQVTLNAADIKDLKIIESRPEPTEQTHSTVAVTKGMKKSQRATVCENLQANPTSSGEQAPSSGAGCSKPGSCRTGQAPVRSKPIDIQGTRSNKNGNHTGSYGNSSSTPKGLRGSAGAGGGGGPQEKARRRNEACFGDAADAALDNDFDFEGNLALFNKRALWEQIRNSHKPDVVRQADDLGKFRHDENVLGPAPAPRRTIEVPDEFRAPMDYVTDEGLVVPAVTGALRARLWAALQRLGLRDAANVLLARAAADVALRLVGGGRRLDARNAHQAPTVVAGGAARRRGGAAALLASHGARAARCWPAPAGASRRLRWRELAALARAWRWRRRRRAAGRGRGAAGAARPGAAGAGRALRGGAGVGGRRARGAGGAGAAGAGLGGRGAARGRAGGAAGGAGGARGGRAAGGRVCSRAGVRGLARAVLASLRGVAGAGAASRRPVVAARSPNS
ncbi:unnamed protein product [Chrysodeixis includens]|uniref:DFDF domain-containing protein n=1 Tax=Chrysodeixis includens TaxID=689277 RepID=A0A9P0FRU1_CHRIL|nr:unnamed protein product [Chrysodeixis includens]